MKILDSIVFREWNIDRIRIPEIYRLSLRTTKSYEATLTWVGILSSLIKAVEARQVYLQTQAQYITKRRMSFFFRSSDDHRPYWCRRSYKLKTNTNPLPCSTIIEVASSLTCEQLALLDRGPKYVLTCQSRFSRQSIDGIIEREYQGIAEKLEYYIYSYCIPISEKRVKDFLVDLKSLLQRLYNSKLPKKLYIRAKREYKLMMGIRRRLCNHPNLILRRSDKSKVFHLGDRADYERKAVEYMVKTNAYQEITSDISPLADTLQQVLSLLDRLYSAPKPLITKNQRDKMYPNMNQLELGHLYFLPKPHKVSSI